MAVFKVLFTLYLLPFFLRFSYVRNQHFNSMTFLKNYGTSDNLVIEIVEMNNFCACIAEILIWICANCISWEENVQKQLDESSQMSLRLQNIFKRVATRKVFLRSVCNKSLVHLVTIALASIYTTWLNLHSLKYKFLRVEKLWLFARCFYRYLRIEFTPVNKFTLK